MFSSRIDKLPIILCQRSSAEYDWSLLSLAVPRKAHKKIDVLRYARRRRCPSFTLFFVTSSLAFDISQQSAPDTQEPTHQATNSREVTQPATTTLGATSAITESQEATQPVTDNQGTTPTATIPQQPTQSATSSQQAVPPGTFTHENAGQKAYPDELTEATSSQVPIAPEETAPAEAAAPIEVDLASDSSYWNSDR